MSGPDNDPIADLMVKEGLSYPEALERLAGEKLGATADDEGELTVAVTAHEGRIVRLDFGAKRVAWLGLDPDAAIAFGGAIIDCAMSIKFQGAKLMAEASGETKQ